MTMTGRQACSIDEYVNSEKSLPTCREMDDENWEDAFLEDLVESQWKVHKMKKRMMITIKLWNL